MRIFSNILTLSLSKGESQTPVLVALDGPRKWATTFEFRFIASRVMGGFALPGAGRRARRCRAPWPILRRRSAVPAG